MQITDRSKDVIKSGGEWIGSIDLENIAMAHPTVAMAACIAAKHAKWDERPLLMVVKKPGAELTRDELIAFFEGRIAKWWTPDDVVFVDAIPLGATGKMLKNRLREQYGERWSGLLIAASSAGRAGVWAAAFAFCWWGLFPLYFRLVPGVPPVEVLFHRIVWACVRGQRCWAGGAGGRGCGQALRHRDTVLGFVASALLIAVNWMTYIWSVYNGHVVDSSLGYFITPLVNVALGYGLLGERPRRAQWVALAIAAAGVLWLTSRPGSCPGSAWCWPDLRRLRAAAQDRGARRARRPGVGDLMLAPAARRDGLVLGQRPTSFPAPDLGTNLWLLGLGPITAVPLLLFAVAARRISLTTLGLLQYIGPTIQLLLGVWVFDEPLTATG